MRRKLLAIAAMFSLTMAACGGDDSGGTASDLDPCVAGVGGCSWAVDGVSGLLAMGGGEVG